MKKMELIIFENVMCCSSGVSESDKELLEFNETLKNLEKEFSDLIITRASMSYNMNLFLENKEIFQLVKENGLDILPVITLNKKIIAKQKYLKYSELKENLKIMC